MEKLVMERRAYDNKYLHRDFHATMDNALAYVGDHFGEAALDQYFEQYVQTRYKAMTLEELEAYFIDIYAAEEAEDALETKRTDKQLAVKIAYCPGLRFLNAHGGASKWYYKSTTALYPALAKKCGLHFELISYDSHTGKAEFVFKEAEG